MSEGQTSNERKLKTIEEEIRRLREPLEKTLLDIREMINSAENPFNFLARSISQQEDPASFGKVESNAEPEVQQVHEASRGKRQAVSFKKISEEEVGNIESLESFISVLAAVDLMVLIVGKEYLVNLVNRLAWKGFISKKLLESIKEALEFMSSMEPVSKFDRLADGQPTFNDILVVLYIISLLVKNDDNSLTFMLLTSSGSFKLPGKNWSVRQ
ncbi:MAG: hypothetical protein QW470_03655 [Candidatus Caldarchaeum sp.]